MPEFPPGEVWLAGAGPGDPRLLTLLALHAVAAADDIVHDALVDARVLGLKREDAVLIPAGKRGGRGHYGNRRPTAGRPTKLERARIQSDREAIVAARRALAAFAPEGVEIVKTAARGKLRGDPDRLAIRLRALNMALTKAGLGDKVTVEHQGAPPVIVNFGDTGSLPAPDADVDGLPPEDDPEAEA